MSRASSCEKRLPSSGRKRKRALNVLDFPAHGKTAESACDAQEIGRGSILGLYASISRS
jgi:hypothetical protein